MGLFDMPPPGVICEAVCKTGILLVIETTWTFDVAFCLPGCCIVCSAIVLPDRPFGEWSPESKKRKMTKSGAPSVVEPHFWHAVFVPLPLCPWYFARVGVGAALLRLLGTCKMVLL